MKRLPEEPIDAATLNGAFTKQVADECGSITVGANLVFMKNLSSPAYIPYSFGTNLINKVMVNGRFLE